MKICYLADINSAHTIKWCEYFKNKGYDIHVISLSNGDYPGVTVHSLQIDANVSKRNDSFAKFEYIKKINRVKNILKELRPDILHAHYASSYGLLGALSNYKPYVLSLWGSDILLFPKEGFIQKRIIKYNLKKATAIFSTSKYMANEAKLYTNKNINITPFGIDLEIFKNNNIRNNNHIVIGIVKSLEKVYGIDYLIKAIKVINDRYSNDKLVLKIVGKGTERENILNLIKELDLIKTVEIIEPMNQKKIIEFYNSIDIAVFPSLSESFGVAVIEAQACGIPVIVSDIKAFYETTIPNKTSFICKIADVDSIVEQLEKLIFNDDLRDKMGKEGEKFVRENFDLYKIFNDIDLLYKDIISMSNS